MNFKKLKEKIFGKPPGLPPYARLAYSQEGEDILLSAIFSREGKKKGFYVDVGAHHPQRFSNTYLLYQRGWCGINIDARPGGMELFKQLRPRDINLEMGISATRQTLTFYQFDEPAVSGFSLEAAQRQEKARNYRIQSESKIETFPLSEVLDCYLPVEQEIDFLTVDVEGLDEEVLRSNNWEKYRPRYVLAEALGTEGVLATVDAPVTLFLKEKGYELSGKLHNTVIYRATR